MRLRIVPALLLAVLLPLRPVPAAAIAAADARTQAFKLQSEGMRLYKDGKYREATEAFQQVVNINLNSSMAYYYLGVCLIAERRYGEAIEPLKIALDLQPDYLQAHLALGDASLKLGDAAEARAEFLRALDLQQGYAPAYDGLGRLLESTGQDDAAEAQYRKALEINVAFADGYTHLGDLFLRRGRLEEAIDLFLKAISVKPDFSSAYTRLGLAFARLHLSDDAIAATRKSLELTPQDPEPYVALARVLLDLESARRAEEAIQAALALDHDHPGAHLILADLKRSQEQFPEAIEVLQGLAERGIEDAQMRKAVAGALKRTRADAARYASLKQAADRSPADPRDLVALGRFLAGQGAHQRSAALLEQAANQLDAGAPPGPAALSVTSAAPAAPATAAPPAPALPDAASIRFEAGALWIEGRLYARAITLYEALLASPASAESPWRSAAFLNLGVARSSLGLDDAAVEAFLSCLTGAPDDSRALLYLGNAYLRLGRKEEARARYAAFLESSSGGIETAQVQKLLRLLDRPVGAGLSAADPAAPLAHPAGARGGAGPS